MIIAIDPGTQMGWCRGDDRPTVAGTEKFGVKKNERPERRYHKLHTWTHLGLAESKVLAYEGVARHAGTKAAHVYGGIVGILQAKASILSMEVIRVPIGTWKKNLTGKGNATKDEVAAAVEEMFPGLADSQDAADAIGIWLQAKKMRDG